MNKSRSFRYLSKMDYQLMTWWLGNHRFKGQAHLPHLWKRLHQLHTFCVNLNKRQQVSGLNCLKQLDHFSCRRRAGLPRILVVHILSVDELLPHRPVDKICVVKQREVLTLSSFLYESTHMSLEGVGFGEGDGRFPSMISLKLLFPTFLASWGRKVRFRSQ